MSRGHRQVDRVGKRNHFEESAEEPHPVTTIRDFRERGPQRAAVAVFVALPAADPVPREIGRTGEWVRGSNGGRSANEDCKAQTRKEQTHGETRATTFERFVVLVGLFGAFLEWNAKREAASG